MRPALVGMRTHGGRAARRPAAASALSVRTPRQAGCQPGSARPSRTRPRPPRRTTAPWPPRSCRRRGARRPSAPSPRRTPPAPPHPPAGGRASAARTASPATRRPARAGSTGRPGSALPCSRFGQVSPGTPRALSAHSPARRGSPAAARAVASASASSSVGTASIRSITSFAGIPGTAVEPMWLTSAADAERVPDPGDQPRRLRRPARVVVDDVQHPGGHAAPAPCARSPRTAAAGRARAGPPRVQVVAGRRRCSAPRRPRPGVRVAGLRGDPGGRLLGGHPAGRDEPADPRRRGRPPPRSPGGTTAPARSPPAAARR